MEAFHSYRVHIRTLKDALPVRHRRVPRSAWLLADAGLIPVAETVARLANDRSAIAPADGIEILGDRHHKQVLRLGRPLVMSEPVISKVFRLNGWRRLRYRMLGYNRFGMGEGANLVTAAARGIIVPKVRGYGRIHDAAGLVAVSVVLIEDLAPRVTVRELLRREQGYPDECLRIMRAGIPVFVRLFEACCRHIDVNPGAVLLDPANPVNPFLIDFEHAVFADAPSREALAFMAGHFAGCCREYVDFARMEAWFADVLDTARIEASTDRDNLTDRFREYAANPLSRSERRRIT